MVSARRLGAALLLGGASLGAAPPPPPAPQLELAIKPVLGETGGFTAIDFALTFPGDRDGTTEVFLPSRWGDIARAYERFSDIKVEGGTLADKSPPGELTLRHAPGARLTLRYRIAAATLRPAEAQSNHRALIEQRRFHLIGNVVLPQPTHLAPTTRVRFTAPVLPAGMQFASDLEHPGLTYDAMIDSVTVGGDYRLIQAGALGRFAVGSSFPASQDAGWQQAYARIDSAVTGWWGKPAGRYLVTVTPFDGGGSFGSFGGTGRGDGFALFATSESTPQSLERVMVHEMVHTWLPRAVGGIQSGPAEPGGYWFSEGFTDWASWRAMVRQGYWTPEQFARQLNDALEEYDKNQQAAATNTEVIVGYWQRPELQRIPYLRGNFIALWLDDELHRLPRPTTLRSVLLAMGQTTATLSPWAVRGQGHGPGLLAAELKRRGFAFESGRARYVDKGEPIEFRTDALSPCGTFETKDLPEFDAGFDLEATLGAGGKVRGVKEDGPAWQAGLRNDMLLLGRTRGVWDDSSKELGYRVLSAGKVMEVRWMPQGKASRKVRRFTLAALDDPARRQACVVRLSD